MKHVGAIRKQIGIPTVFNVLGPLTNPARPEFQLLGVGKKVGLLSFLVVLVPSSRAPSPNVDGAQVVPTEPFSPASLTPSAKPLVSFDLSPWSSPSFTTFTVS